MMEVVRVLVGLGFCYAGVGLFVLFYVSDAADPGTWFAQALFWPKYLWGKLKWS